MTKLRLVLASVLVLLVAATATYAQRGGGASRQSATGFSAVPRNCVLTSTSPGMSAGPRGKCQRD